MWCIRDVRMVCLETTRRDTKHICAIHSILPSKRKKHSSVTKEKKKRREKEMHSRAKNIVKLCENEESNFCACAATGGGEESNKSSFGNTVQYSSTVGTTIDLGQPKSKFTEFQLCVPLLESVRLVLVRHSKNRNF